MLTPMPTDPPHANASKRWEQLAHLDKFSMDQKFKNDDFPKISIVIPTYNSSQLIPLTLESVLGQNYPNYEVIIVDCSCDRTLESIKNYENEKIQIFSIANCKRYEMLNKGLTQASGEYINFIFPGDYYIYSETLKYMMTMALENNKPDLVYCGTLLREAKAEAKTLFRELSLDLLKKGQQPTSLQSCWFKTDVVRALGKFNPTYNLRGGFDLMCRFELEGLKHFGIMRILIDYDLRAITKTMITQHFLETMKALYRYFGLMTTVRWLFLQKDTRRLMKSWMHSLKIAFLGR